MAAQSSSSRTTRPRDSTSRFRLLGAGFLTDGTLEAQGDSAQGLLTTLHYGDGLTVPKDKTFRAAYAAAYKMQPDVYAVQGYDAAQLLGIGLTAVKGDFAKSKDLYAAMGAAKIDSPRGMFTLGKNHDPVQDIYLRRVEGKENKVIGVAVKSLADPGPRLHDVTRTDGRLAFMRGHRLPDLAAELVSLKVDVLVAFGTKALSALVPATTTIPIVDPVMGDPALIGLSGSLARPEGNVTGSVQFSARKRSAKKLEFLKEAAPANQAGGDAHQSRSNAGNRAATRNRCASRQTH